MKHQKNILLLLLFFVLLNRAISTSVSCKGTWGAILGKTSAQSNNSGLRIVRCEEAKKKVFEKSVVSTVPLYKPLFVSIQLPKGAAPLLLHKTHNKE